MPPIHVSNRSVHCDFVTETILLPMISKTQANKRRGVDAGHLFEPSWNRFITTSSPNDSFASTASSVGDDIPPQIPKRTSISFCNTVNVREYKRSLNIGDDLQMMSPSSLVGRSTANTNGIYKNERGRGLTTAKTTKI